MTTIAKREAMSHTRRAASQASRAILYLQQPPSLCRALWTRPRANPPKILRSSWKLKRNSRRNNRGSWKRKSRDSQLYSGIRRRSRNKAQESSTRRCKGKRKWKGWDPTPWRISFLPNLWQGKVILIFMKLSKFMEKKTRNRPSVSIQRVKEWSQMMGLSLNHLLSHSLSLLTLLWS